MAGPGLSLLNLARGMKLAALLFFLLPWATVSCAYGQFGEGRDFGPSSETIVRPSGLTLATGSVRMLQDPPAAGATPPANPLARADPFVGVAAALILAALVLTFLLRGVRGRLAALGALVLAGGGLCHAVLVRLPHNAQDYAAAVISADTIRGSQLDPAELVQLIEVRTEPGFWLTLAALAGAAVLIALSARNRVPPLT